MHAYTFVLSIALQNDRITSTIARRKTSSNCSLCSERHTILYVVASSQADKYVYLTYIEAKSLSKQLAGRLQSIVEWLDNATPAAMELTPTSTLPQANLEKTFQAMYYINGRGSICLEVPTTSFHPEHRTPSQSTSLESSFAICPLDPLLFTFAHRPLLLLLHWLYTRFEPVQSHLSSLWRRLFET